MGVLEAVAGAGQSVPGDLSVAGHDNTTFAALGPISLTSVDQAGPEIGRNAARLRLSGSRTAASRRSRSGSPPRSYRAAPPLRRPSKTCVRWGHSACRTRVSRSAAGRLALPGCTR
ncbi:substrate-binding domain-containing protein [Streptomyces sp. NPDC050564]|uniref:substrate-binding domain-containing protein n=1 Tax=Streptomyces sp. NPDC050564 TaxID=3365631 RepID=UPI0037B280FB